MNTIAQFANPTALVVVALLGLAFVRFGIWWAILRVVLAPLLRPAGLLVVAAAVVVALHLGG